MLSQWLIQRLVKKLNKWIVINLLSALFLLVVLGLLLFRFLFTFLWSILLFRYFWLVQFLGRKLFYMSWSSFLFLFYLLFQLLLSFFFLSLPLFHSPLVPHFPLISLTCSYCLFIFIIVRIGRPICTVFAYEQVTIDSWSSLIYTIFIIKSIYFVLGSSSQRNFKNWWSLSVFELIKRRPSIVSC